jgi:hypothetical protein
MNLTEQNFVCNGPKEKEAGMEWSAFLSELLSGSFSRVQKVISFPLYKKKHHNHNYEAEKEVET